MANHTFMVARYLANLPLYDNVKPYNLQIKPPLGIPRNNIHVIEHEDIPVHDARGAEASYRLDTQGFQFAFFPVTTSLKQGKNLDAHFQDVENFLKILLRAQEVRVFEHKFRTNDSSLRAGPQSETAPIEFRRPTTSVHIDQTAWSAKHRIEHHFPNDAQRYLSGHYQLINIWRPLVEGPLQDCPLALCDSRTVEDDDLVATDLIYENYEGEQYRVKYNSAHTWYYWSRQTSDEVILIKNFDSASNIRCPHAAFHDPQTPANAPKRISLEIRALVWSL